MIEQEAQRIAMETLSGQLVNLILNMNEEIQKLATTVNSKAQLEEMRKGEVAARDTGHSLELMLKAAEKELTSSQAADNKQVRHEAVDERNIEQRTHDDAPTDRNIPSPWKPFRTPQGEVYYHNVETKESVWKLPPDCQQPDIDRKEPFTENTTERAEGGRDALHGQPQKAGILEAPLEERTCEHSRAQIVCEESVLTKYTCGNTSAQIVVEAKEKSVCEESVVVAMTSSQAADNKRHRDEHQDDKNNEHRAQNDALNTRHIPSQWKAYHTDQGLMYYHNDETKESVWQLPPDCNERETERKVTIIEDKTEGVAKARQPLGG